MGPDVPVLDYEELARWSIQDVTNWLRKNGFAEFSQPLRDNSVDGSRFAELTTTDLRKFKCPMNKQTNSAKKLLDIIANIKRPTIKQPSRLRMPPTVPSDDSETEDEDDYEGFDDDFSDDSGEDAEYIEVVDCGSSGKSTPQAMSRSNSQKLFMLTEHQGDGGYLTPNRNNSQSTLEKLGNEEHKKLKNVLSQLKKVSDVEIQKHEPAPPPRSRKAPAIPPSYPPQEEYEDPDEYQEDEYEEAGSSTETFTTPQTKSAKAQKGKNKTNAKPFLPSRRPPAPIPVEDVVHSLPIAPLPPSDDQENYDHPDDLGLNIDSAPPPPPPRRNNQRKSPRPPPTGKTKKATVPVKTVQQDSDDSDYEKPNDPTTPTRVQQKPKPAPKEPVINEPIEDYMVMQVRQEPEDNYLDMNNAQDTPTTIQIPAKKPVQKTLSNEKKLPPRPKKERMPVPPPTQSPDPVRKTKARKERTERTLPLPPKDSKKRTPSVNRELPDIPTKMDQEDLSDFEWYHENLTRNKGQEKLTSIAEDGTFVIRESNKQKDRPFTLMIYLLGEIYNLPIRLRADGTYALGSEKPNEQTFENLSEMVKFFGRTRLIVGKGKQTRLKYPLSKT